MSVADGCVGTIQFRGVRSKPFKAILAEFRELNKLECDPEKWVFRGVDKKEKFANEAPVIGEVHPLHVVRSPVSSAAVSSEGDEESSTSSLQGTVGGGGGEEKDVEAEAGETGREKEKEVDKASRKRAPLASPEESDPKEAETLRVSRRRVAHTVPRLALGKEVAVVKGLGEAPALMPPQTRCLDQSAESTRTSAL